MDNVMKIFRIVGAILLASSFQVAAFVSKSPAPVGQKANVSSIPYSGYAIPSEALDEDITKIVPIAGCNCAFCTAIRGVIRSS